MTSANVDAVATAVLSWLLTYAIHSTILLVVAAVAAWRFADRHAWLDLIWKTALIAPLVTASLPLVPIAVPPGGTWAMPGATTVTGAPIAAPASAPAGVMPPMTASHMNGSPPVARAAATEKAGASTDVPESAAAARGEARPPSWRYSWLSIAAALWLIIAVAALARYGVRLRRVYHALGSGTPVADADLLAALDRLRRSANQRRPIRLTTSGICPVPLALAGRHIVLPARFVRELDADQQHAAIAHEMAHVARRDPGWQIAADILERALFFQPLNRLARARLSETAEFLCDEWAVQQTESPLALARCLSTIASWWSPADELPAGVSAMARSDSKMVRRVTRILNDPARVAPRPRLLWLAIPVMLVAVAAPRVQGTPLAAPVAVRPAASAAVATTSAGTTGKQRAEPRQWTAADIATARAQVRVHRPARPADSFEERWRQALADAGRQGLGDFWIVYSFNTPTHAGEVMMSDSDDGSFVSSDGRIITQGPPLTALFGTPAAVPLDGGTVVVLLHYRGTRADAIDRVGYRSAQLGFDFGRTPVFWLGEAPESQSFERVEALFGQTRTEKIQRRLIDLASLHSNTDVVLPFLTRLVDPLSWPSGIRAEAAEGFEHHHDPRSVEVLLRVSRTDPVSSVRVEAAESIGDVQVPQSIPALTDLVSQSPDPAVRGEAAEAFGAQPAERALPVIEQLLATSTDDAVLVEIIEALGDLQQPGALPLLVRTANTHRSRRAQQEAVETIGDIDDPGAVEALTRLAWEHPDATVQHEAVEALGDRQDDVAATKALERIVREHRREEVQVEALDTLGDVSEGSLHPAILELALSGRTARIRREALESIGEAVGKISDPQALDRAHRTIERAVFDDPDQSVRIEALEALDELPDDRALRVLRDVIARHPDPRVRREAEEHVRERR